MAVDWTTCPQHLVHRSGSGRDPVLEEIRTRQMVQRHSLVIHDSNEIEQRASPDCLRWNFRNCNLLLD